MTQATQVQVPDFALVIIQQMGGMGRLKAMVAANTFVCCDKECFLRFRFKGTSKCNLLKITLRGDLYDLEFWKIPTCKQMMKGVECVVVEKLDGVYYDNLISCFKSITGLSLSL